MKKITAVILLCFSLGFTNFKSYSQCVNLYLGAGNTLDYYDATFTPIGATMNCNAGNFFIYPQQPGAAVNEFNTPCMRFIVNPTNANSATRNSITLYEGAGLTLIGCQGPLGTCANNIGPMPNNSNSTLFASYLDPTSSHTWSICNVAAAAPNMNYTVASCYNNTPITTGVWNAGFVGCNAPIVIPPNTTIGTCTYNISPFVAGALTSYPWSEAQVNPSLLTPGTTYTITYSFNSGNGACPVVTATRTLLVNNPYNSSWTAVGPLCANGACVNLPPQVTGTAGGTWAGTGVVSNSFCPSVGAGSYPVTYSVGISPLCSKSTVNNISVTPVPTANAGPTKSLTCSQTTTVLAGSGGGSYAWSGPGITGGGATATPTVISTGTYSLSVTVNGCTSNPATVTVVQNTTQPVPTATTSGAITCINNTVSLSSSPLGMTYTWVPPGGSSIISGVNSANATGQGPGTYTIIVKDPTNGCSSFTTVTAAQNTVAPGATPSTSGVLTCTNSVISLSVSPSLMNYTWTATGGSSITAGVNSQNATGNGPGPYTVTVQNPGNGCISSASISAVVNTTVPGPTSASAAGVLTCANLTTNMVGSPTVGVTYNWSGPGIVSGGNTSSPVVNAPGNYTMTVTSTVNGCTNTAVGAVTQNTTQPASSATSSGTITCVATAVNLTVTPAGMTYTWTPPFGGAITSGVNSQFATGNGAGIYTVMVLNPANGCSKSATVQPITNTTPPSPSIAPTPSITCTTTLVTLSGSPPTNVLYNWTGAGIIGASNQMTVNVNQVGTYSLMVTSTVNGCTAQVSASVGNFTNQPVVNAGSTQTVTCLTPSVQLIGSANPSTCTPVWTSSVGVCGGANSYTATACSAGIYTLTATNPANGCSNSSTVQVVPNAGSPLASVANTGTITCLNLTSQVTSTTAATPVIYTWSGPGIIGGAGTPTITVNMGGVYTLTLTNTLNGCSSVLTNSVTANNAPVTPTATSSATITCNTTTTSLTAGAGAGSYTYVWAGPGIVGSNTLSTITANTGGAYTATLTNITSGCTGTVSISAISNTTVPSPVSVTPSSFTLSCVTPTTQLVVTSVGGSTYTWTAPPSGSILSGANSTTASISGPGIYTVVATGTNGCSAPAATANVIANQNAPSVNLSANTTSITCLTSNPGVTVTPTGTVTIASYTWSPAAGIASGSNSTTPTFTAAGTYSCLITANNGCTSSTFVTVSNNSVIPSTITTPTVNNISCLNTSVIINPAYTPTTGLTYTWTGTGIVGANNTGSVTVNQSGTYTVNIVNPSNGCVNSITVSVIGNTVVPTATVSSSTSTLGIGCSAATSTAVLTANSTPSVGLIYSWSTGVNTSTMSTSTPGTYTVVVTNAANSCSVVSLYTVNNNTMLPNANAGANGSLPCGAGATYTMNGTSTTTTGVTYTWMGSGIVSGSNTPNPVINSAGVYTLTVTDPNSGCASTSTVAVVNATVVAGFTVDNSTGVAPLTVNFTNTSTGANSYNWNFGTGATSTQTNTSAVFIGNGTFVVTLIATSGSCSDTATMNIIVNDGLTIEVPNVFTPNEDGVNDFLTIKSTGVKELTLQIFNRWGQQMYEFTGVKCAWDGVSTNGNKVPTGTYFYFVKATGFDDKEITRNGPVSLFR